MPKKGAKPFRERKHMTAKEELERAVLGEAIAVWDRKAATKGDSDE